MQIDFYTNFYKKNNSTKRPVEGGIVAKHTITGYFKEPCSILNPIVNIQNLPFQNAPCVWTYAYIPRFGRYYFVNDWIWNDGLWTVNLEVDVLATYRGDIGTETEYILRTDSTSNPLNYNGAITDGMYPATTNFDIQQIGFTNPFVNQISQGTYIIGVISKESSDSVGAITYYALTPSQFNTFKQVLLGTSALESMGLWDAVTGWTSQEMTEQIFKTMYNPYQYISSCMWFPVSPSDIPGTAIAGTSSDQMKIGWWGFNIAGKRISTQVGAFHDSVEQMPSHPLAATRGKYLNYAPYTKMTLYGKFGSIPVDTAYLEVGNYLVNTYSVDYISGQCLFQTFVADNSAGLGRKLLSKTEFLIGVPIQIAQIGRDYLGMTADAINAGGAIATGAMMGSGAGVGGMIIGGLASGAGAIVDTINSSMPQMRTSGVNGSFIGNELSTILIVEFFDLVDEDIEHRGRPLCENRRIDTLSGYVLCAEGDLDLNAFDLEREKVTRFLTTGFFWE